MTHYADAKLSLSEWVQDKAALIGKDFLTALWHHVTSDHVIDLMLTLLFFLSTFASLMIILVEVLGIPLLWFTTLPDNGKHDKSRGLQLFRPA